MQDGPLHTPPCGEEKGSSRSRMLLRTPPLQPGHSTQLAPPPRGYIYVHGCRARHLANAIFSIFHGTNATKTAMLDNSKHQVQIGSVELEALRSIDSVRATSLLEASCHETSERTSKDPDIWGMSTQ